MTHTATSITQTANSPRRKEPKAMARNPAKYSQQVGFSAHEKVHKSKPDKAAAPKVFPNRFCKRGTPAQNPCLRFQAQPLDNLCNDQTNCSHTMPKSRQAPYSLCLTCGNHGAHMAFKSSSDFCTSGKMLLNMDCRRKKKDHWIGALIGTRS